MSEQRLSTNANNEATMKPSSDTSRKKELIGTILRRFALPSVYNRQLMDEDFELWEELLKGYSVDEIAYAFDCWGRSEVVWPPPAGIITIANAYRATNKFEERRDLPSGRGALSDSWPVWSALFQLICERVENFKKAKKPYETLRKDEIELLLGEAREMVEKKKVRINQNVSRTPNPPAEGVR